MCDCEVMLQRTSGASTTNPQEVAVSQPVCDDQNVEEQAGEPVDDGWTETILGDQIDPEVTP
jgi:hypothetical protein